MEKKKEGIAAMACDPQPSAIDCWPAANSLYGGFFEGLLENVGKEGVWTDDWIILLAAIIGSFLLPLLHQVH